MIEPLVLFAHHIWRMLQKFPAASALFVFILTQIAALGFKVWDSRTQKRRTINGLHAEIDRNLREDASNSLTREVIERLKEKVKDNPKYRPMIIIVFQDSFYKGVIKDLPILNSSQLRAVNDFYFFMQQMRDVMAGIERETFFLLSADGRQGLFDDMLKASDEMKAAGQIAKSALKT